MRWWICSGFDLVKWPHLKAVAFINDRKRVCPDTHQQMSFGQPTSFNPFNSSICFPSISSLSSSTTSTGTTLISTNAFFLWWQLFTWLPKLPLPSTFQQLMVLNLQPNYNNKEKPFFPKIQKQNPLKFVMIITDKDGVLQSLSPCVLHVWQPNNLRRSNNLRDATCGCKQQTVKLSKSSCKYQTVKLHYRMHICHYGQSANLNCSTSAVSLVF